MERFRNFGFAALDNEMKTDLTRLNSKLEPLMMRYQGMGWYDLLVRHRKGYAILPMGGENGYTEEDNDKKYKAVGNDYEFKSLDDLLASIKKKPWQEIGSQDEFQAGVHQEVRTIYPSDSDAVESSSADPDEMDYMNDFLDPLENF